MTNVTIFGAGYVGIPTGAHFSRVHKITIYDPDATKIDKLNKVIAKESDQLHIHEAGLVELLQENKRNLHATTDINVALSKPDIIFVAVGTPPNEKGRANLKYVCACAELIAKHVKNDVIILNKSTVPPGTAYLVQQIIEANLVNNIKFSVGSCPEFLAEGTAIEDLRTPDRIVYGFDDQESIEKVTEFFSYLHGENSLCPMSTLSSEITKYAANALLATKISFMNSLAMLCDELGANIREIQKGVGRDTRIGSQFLHASMGYGGSCFPKDTSAIAEYGTLIDFPLEIIESTILINNKTRDYFGSKILKDYNGNVEGKDFILWGIGFKARTDDLRASKPVDIARMLMDKGAHLHIYDTVSGALTNFEIENEQYKGKYTLYDRLYSMFDACKGAGLIIGNEHERYRNPDEVELSKLEGKFVYDGKNVFSTALIKSLKSNGFAYRSIGKDVIGNAINKKKLVDFLKDSYVD